MEQELVHVDHALLRKLVETWPKRASVREHTAWLHPESYDPMRPDYPMQAVPFRAHPRFLAAPPEQRQQVLTWAWLVYNQRTIAAETYVANPAFSMIMEDRFPGVESQDFRLSVQQSLVDEHFHTLMHQTAMNQTRKLRNTGVSPPFPPSITHRRLLEAQARVQEQWEKDLLVLTFAIVSEISINAYLDILADSGEVQPLHSLIARYHNRDEYAHAALLVEGGKLLYLGMNDTQRSRFIGALPAALEAFVAHDFSAWEIILHHVGVEGAEEIIADSDGNGGEKSLVRDYSGLERLVQELEIEGEIEFEFGRARGVGDQDPGITPESSEVPTLWNPSG